MPQYYFRVRDGGSLLPDDGASQEFATMEEVREEAVESARQLLNNASGLERWKPWTTN